MHIIFHKLVSSFFKINTGHNSQIYCSSKIHKIRLCSIPYLQIVMEAKECSYQSKARLNIVKSLGAYNYMEHLENITILDEQSDITLEES